uniref:Ashwin n=1 Tax=Ciona savignyi TaxID=51511 RepID=H2ZM73_CIOSA
MEEEEDALLSYTFPETTSSLFLEEKLRKHGIDAETLDKIRNSQSQLVQHFFLNCASLPRRQPRDNRRGNTTKKRHKKEEKFMNLTTFQSEKVDTPEHSCQLSSGMSEMDKLKRRSQLAKQSVSGTIKNSVKEKLQNIPNCNKESRLSNTPELNENCPNIILKKVTTCSSGQSNTSATSGTNVPIATVKKTGRIKLKRTNCISPALKACKIMKTS